MQVAVVLKGRRAGRIYTGIFLGFSKQLPDTPLFLFGGLLQDDLHKQRGKKHKTAFEY